MNPRPAIALLCCAVISCSQFAEGEVSAGAEPQATDAGVFLTPPDSPDAGTRRGRRPPSPADCGGAKWCVTTIAGGGKIWQDGAALAVKIHSPSALTVALNGDIYFSERETTTPLRKLSGGQIVALATTKSAFAAPPTRFWLPECVAMDLDRSLLIGGWSHRIRRLENGTVRVVVGASPLPKTHNKLPSGGYVDGPVAKAQLNIPTGVAVDSVGRIAIADLGNLRVRLLDKGEVTTLHTMKTQPWGLAFGPDDRLYVVDRGSHQVLLIDAGKVSVLAGTGKSGHTDGPAAKASFHTPHGVAVDAQGRVFVADWGSSRVRMIEDGVVTTVAGSSPGFADGPGSKAKFNHLVDVAVDTNGDVYVADTHNGRLRKLTRMSGD